MSDQESSGEGEGDGKGMCCKNCSSTTTKCGYYITFLVGLIVFVYGFIQLLTADVLFLIIGSLLILCCPLWIKDFSSCFADLKNPLRLSSTIIFLAFLIGTIICSVSLDSTFLNVVLGICLGLSGIWYFLSFFENGQKACISCLKGCCSSEK